MLRGGDKAKPRAEIRSRIRSLSFLNIQPDEANKHFNCPETTQQKLINLQFWLIDFIEDVKTKFGANRFLVKIKFKNERLPSSVLLFFVKLIRTKTAPKGGKD